MAGGDLHWIWPGYEIYERVDYVRPFISLGACPSRPPSPFPSTYSRTPCRSQQVYGVKAFQRRDGFPPAQCACSPHTRQSGRPFFPSFPQYRGTPHQRALLIFHLCSRFPNRPTFRFLNKPHDDIQDCPLPCPGVFLRLLQYWSQQRQRYLFLLHLHQWVSKRFSVSACASAPSANCFPTSQPLDHLPYPDHPSARQGPCRLP